MRNPYAGPPDDEAGVSAGFPQCLAIQPMEMDNDILPIVFKVPRWLRESIVHTNIAYVKVIEHHLMICEECHPTVVPIDPMKESVEHTPHVFRLGHTVRKLQLELTKIETTVPPACQRRRFLLRCKEKQQRKAMLMHVADQLSNEQWVDPSAAPGGTTVGASAGGPPSRGLS